MKKYYRKEHQMNRLILLGITMVLGVSFYSHASRLTGTSLKKEGHAQAQLQAAVEKEENIVRNLVGDFGKKLQMVSLTAPPEIVSRSMREYYSSFISAALLRKWQSNPQRALGRMVSSPWPDRIEILSLQKTSESVYKISGEIVEITSAEKINGGIAAKRPVTLMVKKFSNTSVQPLWLIDEATAGPYAAPRTVVYQNTRYGFEFALPDSWRGYTIVTDKWEGSAIGEARTVETGPIISIRHLKWTSQNQRQDIPIMIFTHTQWDLLQQEKFHIGAAPIGPSELGRNSAYVFALPARYNYAFPAGFEEVEEILKSKPLRPVEIPN